jgi:hypothetical protein
LGSASAVTQWKLFVTLLYTIFCTLKLALRENFQIL